MGESHAGLRVAVEPYGRTGGPAWALFADWCSAGELRSLPAEPDTVLGFLDELPVGAATAARRVRAIDTVHSDAGLEPPGRSPSVLARVVPPRRPRFSPTLVADALAAIPIGGWPTGIVGRRDAALVAVVCTDVMRPGGLARREARAQTVGPILPACLRVEAGLSSPGGCPACAVSRWLRVHALAAAAGWRTVRSELADIGEERADSESAHDCTREIVWPYAEDRSAPLFVAINRPGWPEMTAALSTRSITTLLARRLAGAIQSPKIDEEPRQRGSGSSGYAARREAIARLAMFERMLDESDAHVEAVLDRLSTA